MARIFWDTNLFIYLFEQNPAFGERVRALRRRMLERRDILFTSAMTVGEVLTKPVQRGEAAIVEKYLSVFRSPAITVLPFDLSVAHAYAAIRTDRSVTRPDAIQLACAASAKVDLFITNDARLSTKVVPGIQFITCLERAPI